MVNETILAVIIAFAISAALCPIVIPFLHKLKFGQQVRDDGPQAHLKKKGTPTMGGIGFLIPIVLIALLLCVPVQKYGGKSAALSLLISVLFALSNSAIGILDDITKLKHKENKGLTAGEKFFLQLTAVIIFLAIRAIILGENTEVTFSFGTVDFGVFYYFLTGFIILGIINSANLTDGIDGLASVVAFAAAVSLFYVSYAANAEGAILSSAIIGGTVGFMIFNVHPAKIFMGDTGSLFLGSLIASSALSLKNPFIALGVGGVYVIEGTSVVLQVIVYKLTKKRLFKMAPLHHHLEKSSWSENKICICAILTTFITSLFAFSICL